MYCGVSSLSILVFSCLFSLALFVMQHARFIPRKARLPLLSSRMLLARLSATVSSNSPAYRSMTAPWPVFSLFHYTTAT